MKQHLEMDSVEQTPVGRDPRKMTEAELKALGHEGMPLLKVIRAKCLDCANGSEAEVRRCGIVDCPLWCYRMNKNPFRGRDLTDEQRAAAGERLKNARLK
jgi:hypothetical protein